RANVSRFPLRSDCAASPRTLHATLSHLYGLAAPTVSALLHPARSTNCSDLPNPIRWSVSAEKYFCSASSLRCYPFSLPVSFISCASSASITWERTASRSEIGLLIPSAFVNCTFRKHGAHL